MTIANQDKQIRQLIERVQVISIANQKLEAQRDEALRDIQSHRDVGESLMDQIGQMEKANIRLLGWQDCAREALCNLMVTPVASDK